MRAKRRRGSSTKQTTKRITAKRRTAARKASSETKATKKAATKAKRVSTSKAKGRQRVKALVPPEEAALFQGTPRVEVVEVTTVEVIAVRGPSITE